MKTGHQKDHFISRNSVATSIKQILKAQKHKAEREKKEDIEKQYREAIATQAVYEFNKRILCYPLLRRVKVALEIIKGWPKAIKEERGGSGEEGVNKGNN